VSFVADAAPGLAFGAPGRRHLPQVGAGLVVQCLVPGGAQDRLSQPLQAEDRQQRADDEADRAQREQGEGRAERRDHDREHDERRGHALEGGPPLPGQAGREHDGQGLDRLHRARHEDGEGEGNLVQRTSRQVRALPTLRPGG